MSEHSFDPVSESMRAEEEKAERVSRAQEAKERKRAEKEWENADEEKYNGQFRKLHFLLDQSKVSCKAIENH